MTEIKDAELHPQVAEYKRQNPMDWVVRHCSYDIIVLDSNSFNGCGNQPDSTCFGAWCAPVDWCSLCLKRDNCQDNGGLDGD